jgi:hypothetical protein
MELHGNVPGDSASMTFQNRIATVTRKAQVSEETELEAQRRWAKRKPTQNSGQILFDGVTTPYACMVRDISSTGAKIEMTKNKYNPDGGSSFLPNQFSLTMPLDRTRVECQSMWRRGTLLGVRFLGAVTHLPPLKRAPMILKK